MAGSFRTSLWDPRAKPWFYFLVFFLLGISVNLVSAMVTPSSVPWWLLVVAPPLLVLFLIWSPQFRAFVQRMNGEAIPSIFVGAKACKGLVVFASMGGGIATARAAVVYHRTQLERVWLICSTQSKQNAESLKAGLENAADELARIPKGVITLVEVSDAVFSDPESIRTCIESNVYDRLPDGMEEDDVMIDFTGGLKTTSAGAFLAGLPFGRRLEVIDPKNVDLNGKGMDPGDTREIRISYRLKRVDRN